MEVDIKYSQNPEDPLQLKTSYIVTGLWEMMVQVFQRDLYCKTVLTLKQHHREKGTVSIKESTLEAAANSTNGDDILVTMPGFPGNADLAPTEAAPTNWTAGPAYPAGRVADPRDPRSIIM